MPKFLKIAHRGFSAKYPENTIPAFAKAIEAGADMIELDLHLSGDDELVVIHDDTINRTSDGRGKVAELSLPVLKRYNYNNGMKNCGFVPISTLAEVIASVGKQVLLNIEIKRQPPEKAGIEKELVNLLRKENFIDRVIVSSFDCGILIKIKELAAEIKTGLIYKNPIKTFRELVRELDVSSLHPSIALVDAVALRWAKACGLLVYPWVVKDRRTIAAYRETGFIDGAIVNDLGLFAAADQRN